MSEFDYENGRLRGALEEQAKHETLTKRQQLMAMAPPLSNLVDLQIITEENQKLVMETDAKRRAMWADAILAESEGE